MVIDLPDIGETGWGTKLNAVFADLLSAALSEIEFPIRDKGGQVYHLAAYGDLSTASGFGNAIDDALDAISVSDAPGILFIPAHPVADGHWTDSVGGHVLPKNAAIMGPGSRACQIDFTTANNTWMTALGTTSDDVLGVQWWFQGFSLRQFGGSRANCKGIVTGNTYRTLFRDVYLQNFIDNAGVELLNDAYWTEAATFDHCSWRNNKSAVRLTVTSPGSGSFSETRFIACNMALEAAAGGQIGLDLDAGADLYGGLLDIKFNLGGTGTNSNTAIKLGAGARIRGTTFAVEGETPTDPIGIDLGAGCWLQGPGRLDLWQASARMRNVIDSTAHMAIGAGVGSWGMIDSQLGESTVAIKTARTTIAADGEIAVAWHPTLLHATITLRATGTSREDEVIYEVKAVGGDFNNPVIAQVGRRYTFSGQAVFSGAACKFLDGVGDNPTFVITIGNRNSANVNVTAVVEAKHVWPSDLHVLEGFPGTMTSAFYGTGWWREGVATVGDGGTIAHGLPVTPTVITVSGAVAGEIVTATADATNITVAIKTHTGAAGTSQAVSWRVSKP